MTAEDYVQASIIAYLRRVLIDGVAFAIPNGGKRSISVARVLKATGVLPGVSDLIILLPGKTICAEVKTAKGRVSPEQRDFGFQVQGLGHHFCILRSIDDARNMLRALNVKTREAE